MSRRHGKDRGIVFKNGLWWVRLYINGREKWYRADSKTQAKTLYGRLKADVREGRYFPEKYDASKALTLQAWITAILKASHLVAFATCTSMDVSGRNSWGESS